MRQQEESREDAIIPTENLLLLTEKQDAFLHISGKTMFIFLQSRIAKTFDIAQFILKIVNNACTILLQKN